MTVLGIPAVNSTVSCIGSTTNFGTFVRVSETTVCTIDVRDQNNVATTGFTGDFGAPTLVPGTLSATTLTSVTPGFSSVVFNVDAPNTITTFTVAGTLVDGVHLHKVRFL